MRRSRFAPGSSGSLRRETDLLIRQRLFPGGEHPGPGCHYSPRMSAIYSGTDLNVIGSYLK